MRLRTEDIALMYEAVDEKLNRMAEEEIGGESSPLVRLRRELGEMEKLKVRIEVLIAKLIDKHKLGYSGEDLTADIYAMEFRGNQVWVCFNDEYMGELLSGNAPCSIYDEMEAGFEELGLTFTDDFNYNALTFDYKMPRRNSDAK